MGINVQLDDGSAKGDEGEGNETVVAEINITPLTDVFLVLLIIFMVTSTALAESEVASRAGMKVVLPKANAAGPVSQRRSDPVLTVTKASELFLGSRKIESANLEAEIRKALQKSARRRCSSAATKPSAGRGRRRHVDRQEGRRGRIAILTAPNKSIRTLGGFLRPPGATRVAGLGRSIRLRWVEV